MMNGFFHTELEWICVCVIYPLGHPLAESEALAPCLILGVRLRDGSSCEPGHIQCDFCPFFERAELF